MSRDAGRAGLALTALSITATIVTGLAGPSGNEQSKLPAPVTESNVSEPTWSPPVPQTVASSTKVSWPGSVTAKESSAGSPSRPRSRCTVVSRTECGSTFTITMMVSETPSGVNSPSRCFE